MFYYSLKGRRGQKGLLELNDSEQISDCLIKVPIIHIEEFVNLLKKHNIGFTKEYLLESRL